jgi:PKD repeat protein
MRKTLFLIFCLLFSGLTIFAQVSENGIPYSFSIPQLKNTVAVPKYIPENLNISKLLEEDKMNPSPFRYAVFEDITIDIKGSGKSDEIPGLGTIWRYRIETNNAISIQLVFKKFIIPVNAKLFLYNDSHSDIAGAFTSKNIQQDSTLVLADFIGNHLIIEYFEPINPEFTGEVILGSVSQAYKDIFQTTSGESYININCPEGKNLQLPKHAVCKITFRDGVSSYLCSGALINNTRMDGKPYFLTANHCISDSAEASSLVAYFNYENEGCYGDPIRNYTITKAKLLSTATASDFTLLLLNSTPGWRCQPYYAGWDVHDSATIEVSGIHHPEGMTKKLCFDHDSIYSNLSTIQWAGNTTSPVSSHWIVNFDEGITGEGSSGSPLFNNKNQIIGQLHGGDNEYDLYGRLCYSYAHSTGKYPALKTFLDPDNTGVMELNGYYPEDNPPDAFFDAPILKVCVNAPANLYDYSVFEPYERLWTITPATYTFINGTNETSSNPTVEFSQSGLYSVRLDVYNQTGSDSMKMIDEIHAGNIIQVEVSSLPENEICDCNFNSFKLIATGAIDYTWNLLSENTANVTIPVTVGDTIYVFRVPGIDIDSTYVLDIAAIGSYGTCVDTAEVQYSIIKPKNDAIKYAIPIGYGRSKVYSNRCATIEPGEPIPPFYSCITQDSWCDEYGTGEDIVERSVWFKFVATNTGNISLASSGMDNELALYEADSAQAILDGNYTLLGANDDRSSTNAYPLIRSEYVVSGKTYWIQVDGSGGGAEGSFYITLTDLSTTGIYDLDDTRLLVYPQPAMDYVLIKGEILSLQPLSLSVYSPEGMLVYYKAYNSGQEEVYINTSAWKPGIYFLKLQSGADNFVARIIKY